MVGCHVSAGNELAGVVVVAVADDVAACAEIEYSRHGRCLLLRCRCDLSVASTDSDRAAVIDWTK